MFHGKSDNQATKSPGGATAAGIIRERAAVAAREIARSLNSREGVEHTEAESGGR
jgi:hypothetical protein